MLVCRSTQIVEDMVGRSKAQERKAANHEVAADNAWAKVINQGVCDKVHKFQPVALGGP